MSGLLRLGLCGVGTVGGEVHRQLTEHPDTLAEAAGRPVEIVAYSARGKRPEYRAEYFADAAELAQQADVDAVVELIGGVDVAFDVARSTLAAGRHLITANKALLAERGGEINTLLRQNPGAWIGFEAAIGGGIPVVKCLGEGLAGNRIRKLSCILNGTSNYILSEMFDSGADFGSVLKQAQELGYAEADPTLDISGGDAAHKLAILASMAFGIAEPLRCITCEGIDTLSVRDFRFARQLNCRIRPLAVAERIGDACDLRAHVALVPEGHALAGIGGVMNAVHIQADPVGEVFLSGPGAGAGATASAVLADIIDLATGRARLQVPKRNADFALLDAGLRESTFYLRLDIPERNRPGIIAEITALLTEQQISIRELIQHGECDVADHIPLLVLTDPTREGAVRAFAEAVRARSDICRELLWLRVEDEAR
ncbi:MAG: homoserine dehydrogenase [Gammaproteobacteria bacterium AqS3]|nr:homoserine dehydrogenase [Gammaproteobacteria bacterium AqS3]